MQRDVTLQVDDERALLAEIGGSFLNLLSNMFKCSIKFIVEEGRWLLPAQRHPLPAKSSVSISSKLRPFVSGTSAKTKINPNALQMA